MNKIINIAVVGLGQVGIYLLNELNIKKKEIELKTGKKINIVAISARDINKRRRFKINKKIFTKSGLMVGLGESKDELIQVMDDLRSADVDFLTIGQYLQPSIKHHPLERYYHPDEFKDLENIAKSKGFLLVSSSPLTRSSYHADEDFAKLQQNRLNKH